MQKKQLIYGLYGLLAGLAIASFLISLERRLIHKPEPVRYIFTALFTCFICVTIAMRIGRRAYIKSCLGIDGTIEKYTEHQHEWTAFTSWIDKKRSHTISIETKKVDGFLSSSINGELFCNYVIPHADYPTVHKFHQATVQQVVDSLIEKFTEEGIPANIQ